MKRDRFKWRVFMGLLNTYAFILAALTGLILVLFGKGLGAINIHILILQTDFLGLSSSQWLDIHILFSLLFVITGIYHVSIHFTQIMNYLKGKSRVKRIRKTITIAAALFFLISAIPSLLLYFNLVGGAGHGRQALAASSESGSGSDQIQIASLGQGGGTGNGNGKGEGLLSSGNGQGRGEEGEGGGGGNGQGTRKIYKTIHTLAGFIFLIIAGLHFYYNWKTFLKFFTARSDKRIRFGRELALSAVLILYVFIGTLLNWQPLLMIASYYSG